MGEKRGRRYSYRGRFEVRRVNDDLEAELEAGENHFLEKDRNIVPN